MQHLPKKNGCLNRCSRQVFPSQNPPLFYHFLFTFSPILGILGQREKRLTFTVSRLFCGYYRRDSNPYSLYDREILSLPFFVHNQTFAFLRDTIVTDFVPIPFILVLFAFRGYYVARMAQKREKIDGVTVYLPTGVGVEHKKRSNGEEYCRIAVRRKEDNKTKRTYFPYTLEGAKDAKALAETIRKEKKEYGQKFGALTDAEKRAIDLWRAYRDECQREACNPVPIEEVMRRALEAVRPQSVTIPFPELANEYLKEMEAKNVSPEHLRKRGDKVRRFSEYFGNQRAGNITPDDVRRFLGTVPGRNGNEPTARTMQDYMTALSHIFKMGVKLGRIDKNPVEALEKPKVRPSEPETITKETAEKILAFMVSNKGKKNIEGLPGLLLSMFCGIRPAELARMKYADIFTAGRNEAYLSRSITKTSVDRRAKIRENLIAWLDYTKKNGVQGAPGDYILPGGTEKQRSDNYTGLLKKIKKNAGVQIPHNALRHTAATMICALDGMADAAEELGHDVRTLQRHYRHSVPREEALAFFNILPPVDSMC